MGSALSTFTDFVASTGPSYLTSADSLINEVQKNSYVMRRFIKGAEKSFVLQGGSSIKDAIVLDEASTFMQYQPNDTFVWQNPQVMTTYTVNWRFSVDHMSWTDQEIELNAGGQSNESLRGLYKRMKRQKEQRMWTSMINGYENLLWRVPNSAEMESDAGLYPYSIPAFINEYSNGLYSGFTTVQKLDPATKTRWKPQTATYSASLAVNSGTAPVASNVIAAFDEMFLKVKFEAPPTKQEYFESPKLNSQFIACSRKGLNHYQQILRSSQDRFTGIASYQDPAYLTPSYGGIDLQYVAALDDIAVYGTGAQTEATAAGGAGAGKKGGRYYWMNGQYLAPVFHSSRYMVQKEPMIHPNQPFTTVVVVDSWWNLVVRSRQRTGIVFPTTDISGF
jgi:hypothetical protein